MKVEKYKKYKKYKTKFIAHMPGAGGNFLCRVLAQGHQPQRFMHEAGYGVAEQSGKVKLWHWRAFEHAWSSPPYKHGHRCGNMWLRITVTTPEEWCWAWANALWKDSYLYDHNLASDPDLAAQHHIRLSDMWDWHTLAPELARIQTEPVNTHQRSLWQQWRGTHCPHPYSRSWQQICEHRWGHLRPRGCR